MFFFILNELIIILAMSCIICNSLNLSLPASDLSKPLSKRRYKYKGPCCSMSCALLYSNKYVKIKEDIIIKGDKGTYVIKKTNV